MRIPRLTPGKAKTQHRVRDQIIREETAFLLQSDERRFARLLRARLLAEGCNLPLCLAQPAFYAEMIAAVAPRLAGPTQSELFGILPADPSQMGHSVFHKTMLWLERRLPDPGPLLAEASLEALSAVKSKWLIPPDALCRNADAFDACLQNAVNRMAAARQRGQLGALALAQVRRRMRLALTVSLLTYLREPVAFQAVFGPLPHCLADMQKDREVFCRVMAFFCEQLPYAEHLASQAFWRVLQTLDTEIRPEN